RTGEDFVSLMKRGLQRNFLTSEEVTTREHEYSRVDTGIFRCPVILLRGGVAGRQINLRFLRTSRTSLTPNCCTEKTQRVRTYRTDGPDCHIAKITLKRLRACCWADISTVMPICINPTGSLFLIPVKI
uniref:hypothetical protein n=1 Tax=Escherichia coli TaxID=562 RepID=UPI001BC8434B